MREECALKGLGNSSVVKAKRASAPKAQAHAQTHAQTDTAGVCGHQLPGGAPVLTYVTHDVNAFSLSLFSPPTRQTTTTTTTRPDPTSISQQTRVPIFTFLGSSCHHRVFIMQSSRRSPLPRPTSGSQQHHQPEAQHEFTHTQRLSPAPPYEPTFSPEPAGPYRPPAFMGYGPSGPAQSYHPTNSFYPQDGRMESIHPAPSPAPANTASRLPFFEAALARTRGEELPNSQPLPTYLPPTDPNHPHLAVGMIPVPVIRPTARPIGVRGLSRSPSPTLDVSLRNDYNPYDRDEDDEKALLDQDRDDYDEKSGWVHAWDQKHYGEDGDISQLPYRGRLSAMPSIHVQSPTTSTTAPSMHTNEPNLLASSTQHFGPAPMGRVGRRTHNAAGHRRIKQKATLDENGFFAVDMPIPTRLAQFLPVKGVEEQKSTRCVILARGKLTTGILLF